MSIIIKWSSRAKLDMKSIYVYIHKESPQGADKSHSRIISAISLLSDNPDMGKHGKRAGTLEVTVKISQRTTYAVIYRRNKHIVTVLRIIHGAREVPDYKDDSNGWLM